MAIRFDFGRFGFGKYVKPVPTALTALCVLAIGGLAIGSCVPPAPEPLPTPAPTPIAAPEPAAAPAPVTTHQPVTTRYASLMDAPISAGDWFYDYAPSETLAIFGPDINRAVLIIRCDPKTKLVGIARTSNAAAPVAMLIRTETAQRQFEAKPLGGERSLVVINLPANDPLLTKLAFSKGRFGVETAGQSPIYPPAWPEITRVIEDCR